MVMLSLVVQILMLITIMSLQLKMMVHVYTRQMVGLVQKVMHLIHGVTVVVVHMM